MKSSIRKSRSSLREASIGEIRAGEEPRRTAKQRHSLATETIYSEWTYINLGEEDAPAAAGGFAECDGDRSRDDAYFAGRAGDLA